MPENQAVWGIDIGQAGLKAIRLRYAEAADQVLAVAFDYIPHSKILNQPDAVPGELIDQSLRTFLARNQVEGDLISISVPSQNALVRTAQLPPVESSKVAEIIKYEAKQQIPFALEDVIWDYQPMGGGKEEGGYMLQAEVGIFAMKRDQIEDHLKPFTRHKMEVELIQVASLAVFNYLCYDVLGIRPDDDQHSKGEFVVGIDMGTDATTLIVTNGGKLWTRNVPLGGNHFTRALTKEMKLTFAKAEHLKCNATKAPDPRAVFQALRPVFNEYVSEIQRSIGFFASVNRDAKITKVVGMGNGFKLAGLQKFLQQNLQYDVQRIDTFHEAIGDAVLNAPLLQENILTFAVPYGLALQGLHRTQIHTSLLPPEILTARKIRKKKPMALVTASILMAGLATSTVGYSRVANSVGTERWGEAEKKLDSVKSEISGYQSAYSSAEGQFNSLIENGNKLIENLHTREQWLEVYKALNECLPRDYNNQLDESEITKRNRIKLPSITTEYQSDLKAWYDKLGSNPKQRMLPEDQETAPEGEGYLFTLQGVHYHDEDNREMRGDRYVVNTLLKNLNSWTVQHPGHPPFPVRQLGISHATIISSRPQVKVKFYPKGKSSAQPMSAPRRFGSPFSGPSSAPGEEYFDGGAPSDEMGMRSRSRQPGTGFGQIDPRLLADENAEPDYIEIPMNQFVVQFVWKPTPVADRLEAPPGAEGAGEEGGGDSGSADNQDGSES